MRYRLRLEAMGILWVFESEDQKMNGYIHVYLQAWLILSLGAKTAWVFILKAYWEAEWTFLQYALVFSWPWVGNGGDVSHTLYTIQRAFASFAEYDRLAFFAEPLCWSCLIQLLGVSLALCWLIIWSCVHVKALSLWPQKTIENHSLLLVSIICFMFHALFGFIRFPLFAIVGFTQFFQFPTWFGFVRFHMFPLIYQTNVLFHQSNIYLHVIFSYFLNISTCSGVELPAPVGPLLLDRRVVSQPRGRQRSRPSQWYG